MIYLITIIPRYLLYFEKKFQMKYSIYLKNLTGRYFGVEVNKLYNYSLKGRFF